MRSKERRQCKRIPVAENGQLISKDDPGRSVDIKIINSSLEISGVGFFAPYMLPAGREFDIKYSFFNKERIYLIKILWNKEKATGNYHGCVKI